jgi:hypothetical protein
MDARGLMHFAEDVFRALRGEALLGSDCSMNDTELIQSLVGNRTRPMLRGDRRTITGARSSSTSAFRSQRLVMPSPGPALVARIAIALARHARTFHDTKTRVMIPVDLRNYAKGLRGTGNLTFPLFIDVNASLDWRTLQKDILKRLAAKEAMRLDPTERFAPWLPLWLIGLVFTSWSRWLRSTGHFGASVVVSHVSLTDTEAFCGGGFRCQGAYFIPSSDNFLPLVVSVISSRAATNVVVSAPEALVDEAQRTQLCEVLRTALQSNVEDTAHASPSSRTSKT